MLLPGRLSRHPSRKRVLRSSKLKNLLVFGLTLDFSGLEAAPDTTLLFASR